MKIIEITANNDLSYYINASEIEAVEVSDSCSGKFIAVLFLKSGKIIFDNELFSNKIDIYKKYFTGERNGQ